MNASGDILSFDFKKPNFRAELNCLQHCLNFVLVSIAIFLLHDNSEGGERFSNSLV